MKSGVLILVLLALSAAARPANGLDVCSMKSEEVSAAQIDRYTRIHIPLGGDMTCEEYISCDLQERERISKCFYRKIDDMFDRWWNDIRWTHVRVMCERLLASGNAETMPPGEEDIERCADCPPSMVENPPPAMQKFRIVNPYVPSGPCWCEYYEMPVPAYKK